jgi:hypothetical protein
MRDARKFKWIRDSLPIDGLVARSILEDADAVIEWIESEVDERRFRVMLVAAIALVRAVGHALRNTDAKNRPELRERIESVFHRWKEDKNSSRIFWEFIVPERNNILKQYEFRLQFEPMVTTAEAEHACRVGSNVFCPIADGPYAGEDVRDVLKLAVEWWAVELSKIES